MQTNKFDHFLLTRFNVRVFEGAGRPTESWLTERFNLFRTFCFGSVSQQSNSNFRWLVFMDEDTPQWLREAISSLAVDMNGRLIPVYLLTPFSAQKVAEEVRQRASSSYVITTRIDNDDAISFDFIEQIQARFLSQEFEFLNFIDGCQLANGRTYKRPYPANPFITLFEYNTPDMPLKTVYLDEHPRLPMHGKVRDVRTGHAMWIQIVHSSNVANAVVGLRARSEVIQPWFSVDLNAKNSYDKYWFELILSSLRIIARLSRKPSRLVALVRSLFVRTGARS